MISQWEDYTPEKFNMDIAKQETERMQEVFKRYNVPEAGHMKEEKDEDWYWLFYCQMDNASTKQMKHIKIGPAEELNRRYEIDADLFAGLGKTSQ